MGGGSGSCPAILSALSWMDMFFFTAPPCSLLTSLRITGENELQLSGMIWLGPSLPHPLPHPGFPSLLFLICNALEKQEPEADVSPRMKRCKSDELQQLDGDSAGTEDALLMPTMDAKLGDSAAAPVDLGVSNPNPAPHPVTRSKPPDLKVFLKCFLKMYLAGLEPEPPTRRCVNYWQVQKCHRCYIRICLFLKVHQSRQSLYYPACMTSSQCWVFLWSYMFIVK